MRIDIGPMEGVFRLEQGPPQGHPFSVAYQACRATYLSPNTVMLTVELNEIRA